MNKRLINLGIRTAGWNLGYKVSREDYVLGEFWNEIVSPNERMDVFGFTEDSILDEVADSLELYGYFSVKSGLEKAGGILSTTIDLINAYDEIRYGQYEASVAMLMYNSDVKTYFDDPLIAQFQFEYFGTLFSNETLRKQPKKAKDKWLNYYKTRINP